MHISRLIVRNFRNLEYADVALSPGLNVAVGDNGSGKSNLIRATRLLLDPTISSQGRDLSPEDFFEGCGGPARASQILVAAEFSYDNQDEQETIFASNLLCGDDDVPRLVYRFRPSPSAIYQMQHEGRSTSDLKITDYVSERVVGTPVDYSTLTYEAELKDEVRDSKLRQYHVIELPALRDVESAMKSQRTSPLYRLLQTLDIDEPTEAEIIEALRNANKLIAETVSFGDLAQAITDSYEALVGNVNRLNVSLGFSEPTLSQILRSLSMLITDYAVSRPYGLDRNGLGFNNLLFAAMQIEYFRRQLAERRAGRLLLIEEPEAHLHPQAQEAFLQTLRRQPFQTVVTTHSPNVTSQSGAASVIAFSRTAGTPKIANVVRAAALTNEETNDLDRYLDATKSTLFFARRVLLVEGGSEVMLMPAFASVMNVDLAKEAIAVVAVNGVHFDIFEKLFQTGALASRCAIVGDGDDFRDAHGKAVATYDDGAALANQQDGPALRFITRTTLEFAICQTDTLLALEGVAGELGAPQSVALYQAVRHNPTLDALATAQLQTYRLASRFGKARFAQALAKRGPSPPPYIAAAITWLLNGDAT